MATGLQELQDGVVKAKDSKEKLIRIRKEIVDFHGEMVLLENYSALNYTGWHTCSCIIFYIPFVEEHLVNYITSIITRAKHRHGPRG